MTDREAYELVARLVAAFPRPEVSEDTVDVYVTHLLPFDYDAVRIAIDRLVMTVKFLPTIAEIRSALTAGQWGELPSAGDAWATVLHWSRKIGGYRPRPCETKVDRMICRAIDAVGGWQYLCHETENIVADRAHFFRVWTEMVTREERYAAEEVWPLPAPPKRHALPEPPVNEGVHEFVSAIAAGMTVKP